MAFPPAFSLALRLGFYEGDPLCLPAFSHCHCLCCRYHRHAADGQAAAGELQPAELVTTFLISNVASICIDEPDLPLAASIVPIFLLTALEILNSTLAWFCPRYARLLFGKPITVIVRGEIRQQALQELRITASDLMEALRGKEYFSPPNCYGPRWSQTAVSAPHRCLKNSEAPPMLPLLLEGTVYRENLAFFGVDEPWLDDRLAEKQLTRPQVLLLLYNGKDLLIVPRQNTKGRPRRGGPERTRMSRNRYAVILLVVLTLTLWLAGRYVNRTTATLCNELQTACTPGRRPAKCRRHSKLPNGCG